MSDILTKKSTQRMSSGAFAAIIAVIGLAGLGLQPLLAEDGGGVAGGVSGYLSLDTWYGIDGRLVSDLTNHSKFHQIPDLRELVPGAGSSMYADNCGSRLRGALTAPVTGSYTFWVAGDNGVEMWLSRDSSKFNSQLIAWQDGLTGVREWDKYPTQKSAPVHLQAGQKYYIEALHKEATGVDHVALAWSYESDDLINLARAPGAVASQSSTRAAGGEASRAIDGNRDGNFFANSVTHTNDETNSWWQVDLGADHAIQHVVLYNRTDLFQQRLSNFRISVLDGSGNEVYGRNYHTASGYVDGSMVMDLEAPVTGRIVKVSTLGRNLYSLNGSGILSLAEVEVLVSASGAVNATPLGYLTNWTQHAGVNAEQSSTRPLGGAASRAIDGNRDGNFSGNSVTHTNNLPNDWWKVDLGTVRPVNRIAIYNRTDTGMQRLSNFRVVLLDAAGTEVIHKDFHVATGWSEYHFRWDVPMGTTARTVRVGRLGPNREGNNILSLAEVEVLGNQSLMAGAVRAREPIPTGVLKSHDVDPLDRDDDDLLDSWELAHGFDTTITWQDGIHAGGADPDHDYLSNYEESRRGLDPFQPDNTQGCMTLEQWMDVPYNSVPEAAVKSDKIYQEPDRAFLVKGSGTGEQALSHFAQRLRGYVIAPESGDYHFWISATNGARLLISTGEDKFHKRIVAEMGPELGTGHGTFLRDTSRWDQFVSQMSGPIHLEAGKKYFIEVVHQHGHGAYPHADIAWARPNAGREEIPGEFLYSYVSMATDADDDSLPDAWEAQYGLSVTDNGLTDRAREGENGDFDGDGLNNHEEYLAGTNPANAETDGDGISDGDEVHAHHTNPLVSDAPSETIENTLDLNTFTSADYPWSMVDGGLLSDTFRGNISWNFAVPSSGTWVIQVDSRIRGSVYANELVHVNVSIDGKFIGRYALSYGASHKGIMRVLSPRLASGSHSLTLEIDNLLGRRMVQIDAITLRQPAGADADADGIPNWVEAKLAEDDFVKPHVTASRTSPFCLEGRARIRERLQLNAGSVLAGGDPQHWYANLSLEPGDDTSYTVDFANGQQVRGGVFWWATNVLDNEVLTVREGDSLRLGAWVGNGNSANTEHPNKKASQANGVVATITVAGADHILGNSRDTCNHRFTVAGTYQITATHVTGATGSLTVIVRHSSMPDDTSVLQNSVSYWTLQDAQADRGLFFEAGEGLGLGKLESIDNASYRFRLYPRDGGRLGVISRLWEGGPILDVADVVSVTLTDALQNGLSSGHAARDFEGFNHLVTPMLVLDLPPGGWVEVTIFRAGVTFLDGSKTKILRSEDFANGLANLEFLLPIGMEGGYCHNIAVHDADGSLIGRR